MAVERLFDSDPQIRINSYNFLKDQITTSTSSMTSIPRPLKFLRTHYQEIKEKYEKWEEKTNEDKNFKLMLCDLLSVLVMVIMNVEENSLYYVLKGSKTNITEWGQEYIRSLCGDIANEYNRRLDKNENIDELYELAQNIIPYLIQQHCENDVIDLLIETEQLDKMKEFVNENNYKKICLYLLSIVNYSADTEEYRQTLELVYNIYYEKYHQYVNAMRVAIKMGNSMFINQTFNQCKDKNIKMQLAFLLARENIFIESDDLDEELREIMSNLKLSDYYKRLGKELEVLEPKHPEDIFKSHLENKKESGTPLESYKINLSHSIASSFINAGFGTEVLLTKENSDWLRKNKDEGITALLGGYGLVNLWDSLEGPGKLYEIAGNNETDVYKRAGRNLGLGICLTGIHDDNDTAIAILLEELEDKNLNIKVASLLGLGIACAGSQKEELMDPILKILQNFEYGFEVSAFCSLCYGLIYIGSASDEVFNELFAILLARNEEGKAKLMENQFFVLYALGLGLICLGKQKDTDFMIETITSIEEFPKEMRIYLKTILTSFAYAGSGNVTKVQELMHLIAKQKEEIAPKVQSIAVLGCALIAIGEEVGTEMLTRSFNHFLQFGEPSVKKTVSLAMALLNLSNPKVTIVDSITKFCYDNDKETAMNAIFSLGLVSAGTNHSRVAGLLRNLAGFYSEDTNTLVIVRIAQGLLHMGKGMLTLNPLYSHNLLLNHVVMAGVLISVFSFTEINKLLDKHQFILYTLGLAMRPRMVMTVNEKLEPIPVQLMVGQAVDIVGQTGNPRTITGFQIHNSPSLIGTGERCELNGDDYISYSDVMENIVIVKENPEKKGR